MFHMFIHLKKVYKIQRTMNEKCLEYSALLAILTQIKKANKNNNITALNIGDLVN